MTAPITAEQLAAWQRGLSGPWGVHTATGCYEVREDDLVVAECWSAEVAGAIAALPELVSEVVRLRGALLGISEGGCHGPVLEGDGECVCYPCQAEAGLGKAP